MQTPHARHYSRQPLSMAIQRVYKDLEKIGVNLSYQTVEHLANKADRLPNSDKKNPVAFLLGFYAIVDNDISATRLKYLTPIISRLEPPLEAEDIIRYAKLFLN